MFILLISWLCNNIHKLVSFILCVQICCNAALYVASICYKPLPSHSFLYITYVIYYYYYYYHHHHHHHHHHH